MRHSLLILISVAFGATPARAYSAKVAAAFKGQIVVTASEVKAQADDAATIAALKAARLTKLPCHFDTAMTAMATFHVAAFPQKALQGSSATLSFTETSQPGAPGHSTAKLLAGLPTGATTVRTGVQVTVKELVGPKVQITLLGPSKATLASTEVDASCLKVKASKEPKSK